MSRILDATLAPEGDTVLLFEGLELSRWQPEKAVDLPQEPVKEARQGP